MKYAYFVSYTYASDTEKSPIDNTIRSFSSPFFIWNDLFLLSLFNVAQTSSSRKPLLISPLICLLLYGWNGAGELG